MSLFADKYMKILNEDISYVVHEVKLRVVTQITIDKDSMPCHHFVRTAASSKLMSQLWIQLYTQVRVHIYENFN